MIKVSSDEGYMYCEIENCGLEIDVDDSGRLLVASWTPTGKELSAGLHLDDDCDFLDKCAVDTKDVKQSLYAGFTLGVLALSEYADMKIRKFMAEIEAVDWEMVDPLDILDAIRLRANNNFYHWI